MNHNVRVKIFETFSDTEYLMEESKIIPWNTIIKPLDYPTINLSFIPFHASPKV